MKRRIVTEEEMKKGIANGMKASAGLVKKTLGPGGKTVLVQRVGQQLNGEPLGPMMTKDGVSVANECFASDEVEDLVIQAVKSICQKTNRRAGDGTTTAIVLGEAILNASMDFLDKNPHQNPQLVKESILAEVQKILKTLDQQKTVVDDLETIEEVAVISANGDTTIGSVIREAFDEVGSEGVITVDEGGGLETTVDIVKGFQIRRGAELKERFFNDAHNTKFEAQDVRVILYDGNLNNPNDALVALRTVVKEYEEETKKQAMAIPPTIFVANEFSQDVLTFFMMQKIEAKAQICAIRSPHATHVRTAMLDDMAILLGGTRLGSGTRSLDHIEVDDIGRADKAVIDKYTTTFYDGWGAEEEVLKRLDSLKFQRDGAESAHDAALLSDRISSLNQAVAKIGVGGATDLEIKEKYHRIEDALNAARAAIEDGVVPGGGTTLLRIAYKLDAIKNPTAGQEILSLALTAPFQQILKNIDHTIEIEDIVKLCKSKTKVFDARHKKVTDSFKAGILDPVKVTKEALINATSISSLLSNCGGGIVYSANK